MRGRSHVIPMFPEFKLSPSACLLRLRIVGFACVYKSLLSRAIPICDIKEAYKTSRGCSIDATTTYSHFSISLPRGSGFTCKAFIFQCILFLFSRTWLSHRLPCLSCRVQVRCISQHLLDNRGETNRDSAYSP